MALGASYATLAQLKSRLNITDTAQDTPLTNALASGALAIEGATGRQFNDVGIGNESARVYYPDDLVTITTDDFQNSAGFVLAFDFSNQGTYTSIIAASNYQLEPLNGVVDGTPGWPFYRIHIIQTWAPIWLTSIGYPRTSVQVTARWGWAAVPAGVTEANLIIAEKVFKLKDAPFGVAGLDAIGGYALRIAREDPNASMLLARYCRNPIQVA